MPTNNSDDPIDTIVGYTPPQQPSNNKKDFDIDNSNREIAEEKKTLNPDTEEDNNKNQSEILMDLANQNIDLLFKDQYGEGYVRILNKDHKEITPINSGKFARFLSKLYYENEGQIINRE